MPIIRTLKETGHSYEAAKQRLLEATAHLQDDDGDTAANLQVHRAPKRNRIISDSSSSSSSSSDEKRDDDDDGDDDADDDEEEDVVSQKRQRGREKKLLRNLEKEMKRKRTIVSISRPSLYKRTETHPITPAKPKAKKPKSAMSMISALNESSEDSDSDEESEVELTKEAQEEEAFSLYKKALEFQRSGNVEKAQDIYNELLQTRFLSKVKVSPDERRGAVTNTAITLKYSSYKNLGNLALGKDDMNTAMENYLEAVNLDSTDVTLWYRIGTVAVKLSQLALARVAFEQGLKCSKLHWPCLDFLCTILYAINDYVTCLYYIAQALERDKRYTKGLALRDQIYSEQPCLRRDCLDLFKHCDDDVYYHEVPKDKRKKIVDDALALRHKRQELAKPPPLPRIKFLQPLTELRWKPLGERLIALYDHMTSKDPPMSLVTIIDMEDYKSKEPVPKDVSQTSAEMESSPIPMDVDPSQQKAAETSPISSRTGGDMENSQIPTETPGHMGEQTQGQRDEAVAEAEESKQKDSVEYVDVETVSDTKINPDESKTKVEDAGSPKPMGTIGSSARTLKQIAESYLKSLEGGSRQDATVASATEMERGQEPPDSTTAGLDSTPAASDLPNIELQADSTAGSSQDSIQQSGRESTVCESSQDKAKLQPDDEMSMDVEDAKSEKSRRGHKRKKMLRDMPAPGKRRSARVRNTTVKKKEEEEIINYTEVLRQFLPSTLLASDDEEEELEPKKSGENVSVEPDVKKTRESPVYDRDAFRANESDDVHSLLVECQLNNGIIDVMSRYLERLVAKHDIRWPDGLVAVFLDVYKRLRKHISLPELFCCDEDEMVVREMSMMCLLSAEFNLDRCLSAKTNGNTPAASPAMLGANTTTCTFKWGEHHEDDMMYLQELTLMQYMLPDLWPVVPARVHWLQARYYLQIGKTAEGEEAFERCKEVLKREEEKRKDDRQQTKEGKEEEEEKMEIDEDVAMEDQRPTEVRVTNIKHGAMISIASITSEVESLQRCQSLEQLQRLHASGEHGKVVELLRPTLRHTPRAVRPENTPERCSQLLLLIQSQMELKDTKESIFCCVLGMVETWQGVQRDGLQAFHQLWLETLNKILHHLQRAFECCEISSLGTGGTGLLRKAVNILIKIIEWTMDQNDVNETTNPTSIMPWVVLYHIIKYEEDHLAAKSLPSSDHEGADGSCSPSSVPMLSSSLMLLENAHDYLGRQSWCCNCEGALLKLYIRVLSTELGKYSEDERHPFSSDLRHTLEQCFFCLYGHPTKKTKTRHLQDHGAIEVQLDWSNCCYIFDYFKPKTFPEFDSYKTSSMSAELEGLLLKISKVIPQDTRPENALELVQGYVDGSNEKAPVLPEGFQVSSTVVQELYYLLADFYFKNKDFGKAIKFYLHDLCVSPDRLDSWAGMALARVGRLDLKLNNSTDAKSDGPIFKHGVAALRCFKRALEIDATNYSLWIEYGSYAYILHSHASRQIKQKDQLNVSDEDVALLSVKQAEMLEEAEHCFKRASMCEGEGDEEWLVHYMLGKVAEKRLLMEESLQHYLKASYHLHESEARYPKKIPYHNPTDFSLEALEMYFRIHSAILKLVQCSLPGTKIKLDEYGTLEGLVQEAAQLPFVRAEEKKREPSSEPSTDTEQESRIRPSKPDTPPSLAPKRRGSPIYVATPQDHDYLHEKYRRSRSRVSSQEDPTTDTASESDIFSGDESMSSFLSAQRSAITLRPVPARRALSVAESQAVPTTTDSAPSVVRIEEGKPGAEEETIMGDSPNQPVQDQPESRTTPEDITATAPTDTKQEVPDIVISKSSPERQPAAGQGEDIDGVPSASTDGMQVLTEKLDEQRTESSMAVGFSDDVDPNTAVHGLGAADAEEPAPTSREEETNKSEKEKTDGPAEVSMEVDEPGAVQKIEAEESIEQHSEHQKEAKEALEGTLEGSVVEEEKKTLLSRDRIGSGNGVGEVDKESVCEPEKMEVIEGGDSKDNEADGFIPQQEEQKLSGDANKVLPEGTAVASEEMETEAQAPQMDNKGKEHQEERGLNDNENKPRILAVEKEGETAELGYQGIESEDLSGLPCPEKGTEPTGVAETQEADCTDVEAKDTVAMYDAPRISDVQNESSDEKKVQEQKSGESEVDRIGRASPKVDGLSQEAGDTDNVLPLQGSLGGKAKGGDPEEMDQESSAEDGKGQKYEDLEKEIKTDVSEMNPQEKADEAMDTSIQEKDDRVQGKEILATETPESTVRATWGKKDKEKAEDNAVTKEETSERTLGETQVKPEGEIQEKKVEIQGKKGETQEKMGETQEKSEETQRKTNETPGMREDTQFKMERVPQGKTEGETLGKKDGDSQENTGETQEKMEEEPKGMTQSETQGEMEGDSQENTGETKGKTGETQEKTEETQEKAGETQRKQEEGTQGNTEETQQTAGDMMVQSQGQKEGDTQGKGGEIVVDEKTKKRHLQLIDSCLGAMRLCLQRFPQHYKAAYRMAYLYAYAPTHKNLAWSKDILIGSSSGYPPKTPADHIVAPGLFSEQHKSKNLFQGIWRNPIQDIDRSGSFPWHMYRSVALLVYILRELKDYILLLQVTSKLYRIPEQGKKYLRDADRLFLAREAFDSYRETIKSQLVVPTTTAERRLSLLLSSYRCFQYTQLKQPTLTSRASELMTTAFKALKGDAIEPGPPLVDQATRFCEHHMTIHKIPRTPTHGEGVQSKGYQRDFLSGSTRPGVSSETRRPSGRSSSSSSDQGGFEQLEKDGKTAGRGEPIESVEGGSSRTKTAAEGSVGMPVKTPLDSTTHVSSRDAEPGSKEGLLPGEKSRATSLEGGGARKAEGSASGTPEGGVKRRFYEMESTGANIASIVQAAARQYEKTEAQRRERLGQSSSVIPQAKRFASGSMETPGGKAFYESTPRVHIGALGSVTTNPRQPQQRPSSLVGTSKQAISSASSASTSIIGSMQVGQSQSLPKGPSRQSQVVIKKSAATKSPLSPPPSGTGSFADSFQKFLKTQQKQLSSVVRTFNVPSPESSVRQNPAPVSKVVSGSLLGQIGLGSVMPKARQTPGATVASVRPKLPVASVRPKPPVASVHASLSQSSSQPPMPRPGISQVAKITSSTPSAPGVRQVSKVGGHRESPAAGRMQSLLMPSRLPMANVGRGTATPEASRLVQPGSSSVPERTQRSGDDLSIIDSTEQKRT
ncbi:calcineurin-binding protein cabin-1-like [Lytechinus variegatus]|uniref:calcineurin-binding protein cabin-1-like n=1 Tax=Lytechinus variegatus TaxID=7654 RepID=UPI001BB0E1F1|nr:calcineurin-binding protein cabin-1-like [Lytechinus variegatus]XP_041466734.1 calcineurin-binding protein cabin-1-like [Lytechinus variegatus]